MLCNNAAHVIITHCYVSRTAMQRLGKLLACLLAYLVNDVVDMCASLACADRVDEADLHATHQDDWKSGEHMHAVRI